MADELPKGWKVLSSEYLYKQPWLTVRHDALELPGGHIVPEYFVLEYPDWINVIAITEEGMFVLVSQYRHGIGKTSFELCAGVCDEDDDDPMATAKRELMEETGYGGGHWQPWILIAPNPATSSNWVHCFLATGVQKLAAPSPEPSEKITTHLVSPSELKTMMMDGSIIQATHLAPLWKYVATSLTQ